MLRTLHHFTVPVCLRKRTFLNVRHDVQMMTGSGTDCGAAVRALVPPLDAQKHKGQAGRIGVVGGCREYTGAPFFAASAALRVGADLSHVFCTPDAAPVIKSYSPELIVHPCLACCEDDTMLEISAAVDEVTRTFTRLDALVVGPGLGRNESVLSTAEGIVHAAVKHGLPVIIDGDGLFLVQRGLFSRCASDTLPRVILTPNINEMRRLYTALDITPPSATAELSEAAECLSRVSQKLGGAVVLQKGQVDIIAAGESDVLYGTEQGSLRRCGGQGDILAGTVAVFAAWAVDAARSSGGHPDFQLAALAASTVSRAAAARAFAERKRSMVAGDVITMLGPALETFAPC